MEQVAIVSAVRTAIGSYGGVFKDISAVTLGVHAVQGALQKSGLSPDQVDEVILGNVLQAGLGQNPARQTAVKAGIPENVPAYTVNKLCGSGLKAVILAAQSILLGENQIVIAGGMESMSNSPYISMGMRWGTKMGHAQIMDSMLQDGLLDAFNDVHMGMTAEKVAETYGITRRMQDEFALHSQHKAEAAQREGRFDNEIIPVAVPQRRGDPITVSTDEYPRLGCTLESLEKLRPAFKQGGTVTAGNASGINDGAAALVLMAKSKAEELGIEPLGYLHAYAAAGLEPMLMGMGPVYATRKALQKAFMSPEDIDLFELNEAFAAQSVAVVKQLGISGNAVNVNGGAIALGHPIGASGARILVTLLNAMKQKSAKTGLAALCIGGGQGICTIIRR